MTRMYEHLIKKSISVTRFRADLHQLDVIDGDNFYTK